MTGEGVDVAGFDVAGWQRGRSFPTPTELTWPFWDGLAENRLMVQRCKACGQHVFRPEVACTRCLATELEWTRSSGTGVVYSHSVVHRAPHPEADVPFVVAVIEVDLAWHLMTNLVGCPPGEVRSGMAVRLRVERVGELCVPLFEPVEDFR